MKERSDHKVGCKCAACVARWDVTITAMREFYELAGLTFFSPIAAVEMATLWRDGITEAFPDWARNRLNAADPEKVDDLIKLILEE